MISDCDGRDGAYEFHDAADTKLGPVERTRSFAETFRAVTTITPSVKRKECALTDGPSHSADNPAVAGHRGTQTGKMANEGVNAPFRSSALKPLGIDHANVIAKWS